ncbi:MAG TPA: peroxiredoxin-like family protein [Polyangiaceae bacterium]
MGSVDASSDEQPWAIAIAACTVLTMDGERMRVRDLWRTGVTATAFLRHYGCIFCLQFAHDVLEAAPEIIARGATLLLVGNGTVSQAKHFFEGRGLPRKGCMVATDPERETYQAAKFHRGFARTFLERPARRAYEEARADGHKITGLFGDLTQLGGLTVTSPPARLVYFFRSEYAGDHPAVAEVLDAVTRATASARANLPTS